MQCYNYNVKSVNILIQWLFTSQFCKIRFFCNILNIYYLHFHKILQFRTMIRYSLNKVKWPNPKHRGWEMGHLIMWCIEEQVYDDCKLMRIWLLTIIWGWWWSIVHNICGWVRYMSIWVVELYLMLVSESRVWKGDGYHLKMIFASDGGCY